MSKRVLSRTTFDRVLSLPEVNFDRLSDAKKQQIANRCIELHQELHLVTEIEGVKKFSGAKYLYEQALQKTMEILGIEISEEEKEDLLIEEFLSV